VRHIQPKMLSWIVYGSTVVVIAAMVITAINYRNSVYWEKKYLNQQQSESANHTKYNDIALLLSNADLENNFLIKDYLALDSMLFSEKFLNADLNKKLTETIDSYYKLLSENNELLKKLGFYQERIDNVLAELQETAKKLRETEKIGEGLQKELLQYQQSDAKELFTVEFMASYKLISISAKAKQKTRKGFKPTDKIRNTDHILISIHTVPDINFDLGNKTVYIRVADPNGNILPFTKDEIDLFTFQSEDILFSDKTDIRFTSGKFPAQVLYHPVTALSPGIYWVYAFCDGIRIGEASFDLY